MVKSVQLNDNLRHKRKIMGSSIFLIMLSMLPLIQLSKVLRLISLESALFSFTFILLICCLIALFLRNPMLGIRYFICVWMVILALSAALYSIYDLSFTYFYKVFIFITTILCILFVTQYPLEYRNLHWIYRISMIQSLIFAFAYVTNRTYPYGILSSITFGFTNPNFTGMWLLHLICINMVYVCKKVSQKKYSPAIFAFAITALDLYFIVLTDSRSSLMGVVLLLIGALLNLKKKRFFHIPHVLAASIPGIVAAIYLMLVNSGAISIFGAFSAAGKELTSRVEIWNEGFNAISDSPIFGAYYDVLFHMSSSQLHNIYIDTAATFGIPMAIAFFWFINDVLKTVASKVHSLQQNMAYWGFCAILFVGSFEASLVSGGTGMYIMSCALLVLALHEQPDVSQK